MYGFPSQFNSLLSRCAYFGGVLPFQCLQYGNSNTPELHFYEVSKILHKIVFTSVSIDFQCQLEAGNYCAPQKCIRCLRVVHLLLAWVWKELSSCRDIVIPNCANGIARFHDSRLSA